MTYRQAPSALTMAVRPKLEDTVVARVNWEHRRKRLAEYHARLIVRCAGCGEPWPCTVASNPGAYRAEVSATHTREVKS